MPQTDGHAHEDELTGMLGEAVVRRWGDLPQRVQELLFEEALTGAKSDDAQLREQLALMLHEHHPRTAAPR
jgi:hypothetical protein